MSIHLRTTVVTCFSKCGQEPQYCVISNNKTVHLSAVTTCYALFVNHFVYINVFNVLNSAKWAVLFYKGGKYATEKTDMNK